tara:strand:+ start:74949 stop:75122 length:174 start_codon:yes stop_codon:yes gene_type:complete
MSDSPNANSKWSKYKVEDGKLQRGEFCPEPGCGPGIFLAIHKDRKSCGKCGYTVKNE